jgi:hypothetical protein
VVVLWWRVRFYQVPAFGGELRPGEHYLTTHGLTAAARLLWALTMVRVEPPICRPIAASLLVVASSRTVVGVAVML